MSALDRRDEMEFPKIKTWTDVSGGQHLKSKTIINLLKYYIAIKGRTK